VGDLAYRLSWSEVLRYSGASSPDELPDEVLDRIQRMATTMWAPVRRMWDAPLTIVSGYRTPATNRAAGGAKKSQHMAGLALDVRTKNLDDLPSLRAEVDAMQRGGEIPKGGLALYFVADTGRPRFLHIDCRGRLARWQSFRNDRLVST